MPRPVVAAAVILAAVGTAWAMWETGLDGPRASWEHAEGTVAQVWGPGAVHPAALATGGPPGTPPTIAFATSRPHQDRGTCAGCHTVTGPRGAPVPAISSAATSTHEPRGVCTNCHRITVAP